MRGMTTTAALYQNPASELENLSIVESEDLFASEDNELQRIRFQQKIEPAQPEATTLSE